MNDPTLTFSAWTAALDRFRGQTPVASLLRNSEWAEVPLALRDRAFFSAGVAKAETVQDLRHYFAKALQGRDNERGTTYGKADFVADMRQMLGAEGDSGDLTDITSSRRLNLIADFQTEQAYGYARRKRDLADPDLLNAEPAWEFSRVEPRKVPRKDWWARWGQAGASVGWQGASRKRMVALKTSPIWAAFSRFGTAYPPFDFGSGMGLVGVSRQEAEALGLVTPGKPVQGGEASLREYDDTLRISADTSSKPDMLRILTEHFGPQVKVDAGKLVWDGKGQRMAEAEMLQRQATEKAQDVARLLEVETLPEDDALQFRAQVASVAVGQKPLYHEQWMDQAQAENLAAQARKTGLSARVVGTHLYVWKPGNLTWAEISKDPIGQPSGKNLGYGIDLLAPGSVSVRIVRISSGEQVGGFFAPEEYAHIYGKARTEDYSRVFGDDFTYRIGGQR